MQTYLPFPADRASSQRAMELLGPHLDGLCDDIVQGCTDWRTRTADDLVIEHAFTPATHAACINRLIWRRIRMRFGSHGTVTSNDSLGFNHLNVEGELRVRCKKLDANLRARNYPTEQQRAVFHQQPMLFDGMVDRPMWVFLGYRLKRAEQVISAIWLTCQNGRQVVWAEQVLSEGATDSHQLVQPTSKASVTVRLKNLGS